MLSEFKEIINKKKNNDCIVMIFNYCRVATGNPVVFTLSPPECYMEIRNGYGTTGTRVAGECLQKDAENHEKINNCYFRSCSRWRSFDINHLHEK